MINAKEFLKSLEKPEPKSIKCLKIKLIIQFVDAFNASSYAIRNNINHRVKYNTKTLVVSINGKNSNIWFIIYMLKAFPDIISNSTGIDLSLSLEKNSLTSLNHIYNYLTDNGYGKVYIEP